MSGVAGLALGQYPSARGNSALNSEFEAPRHAWTLSNLTPRHAEETLALARTDWCLFQLLGSLHEQRSKALLSAVGPSPRRRVGARGTVRCVRNQGNSYQTGRNRGIAAHRREEFKDGVSAKLVEKGISVQKMDRMKNIHILLAEDAGLAQFYVLASQYTHAEELVTRSYRKDPGTKAVYGDLSQVKEWIQPLWMTY